MSNRTVFYLAILMFVSIGLLFLNNMKHILEYSRPSIDVFLKHNSVRGIAVEHNKLLYTLNFKQQNQVIDIINRSLKIVELPPIEEKASIDKIIIYQFNDAPDINIEPIGYKDNDLIYSAPQLFATGYLMEISEGELKEILSQTYDH